MIKIRPSAPLGRYPQFRLCGQEGIAPTNSRTRMIKSSFPFHTTSLTEFRLCFRLCNQGRTEAGRKVIVFGVRVNSAFGIRRLEIRRLGRGSR